VNVDGKRTFLEQVLRSGLEHGTITPDDIVRHLDPEVLAPNLPSDLTAKLLQAGLKAASMTPALIVDTVGTEALAQHLPMHLVWGCVAECADRALGGHTRPATMPEMSAAPAAKKTPDPKPAAKAAPAKKKPKAKIPDISSSKSSDSKTKKPNARAGASKSGARKLPPSPRRSGSDFDVDTDVGENWASDAVVEEFEIVEEDSLGASPLDAGDWKTDEETRNSGPSATGRKR
jgi:hypothetical protein